MRAASGYHIEISWEEFQATDKDKSPGCEDD